MLAQLLHKLGMALIPLSARVAMRTWTEMARPPGPVAIVHAGGATVDRVLLAGGSSAVGFGTVTHDLALAGHLARQTSLITGRGLDIEVNAHDELTVSRVRESLTPGRACQYDAIVLTVGTREAYELIPVFVWRSQLKALLDLIASTPGRQPEVILVGAESEIPVMLPRWIATPGRARVHQLNAASRLIAAARRGVVYVDSTMAPGRYERDDEPDVVVQEMYAVTAEGIASSLAAALDRAPRQKPALDEDARIAAVEALEERCSLGDPRIDQLVATARAILGVYGATLDVIGADRTWAWAASGVPATSWPRAETLANDALAGRDGLAVADLAADPRYRDRSFVTGPPHLRFYAGYPVVSPDGHRVATLSIFDTRPRTFRPSHARLLQQLAQRAGRIIYDQDPRDAT